MDFLKTISVAASGLKAQSGRMRVIAGKSPPMRIRPPTRPVETRIAGAWPPSPIASIVSWKRIRSSSGGFARIKGHFARASTPAHPAADENGEVKLPNVNSLIEQMDMREAQRSYEANLNLVTATRRMISRTIEILRA